LNLTYDEALSNIAFNVKLRRYSADGLTQLASSGSEVAATVGTGATKAAKGAAAAASSAAGGAADPTPLSTLFSQVRRCSLTLSTHVQIAWI